MTESTTDPFHGEKRLSPVNIQAQHYDFRKKTVLRVLRVFTLHKMHTGNK